MSLNKNKNVHVKPFWRYTGMEICVFKNLSGSHLNPDRAEIVATRQRNTRNANACPRCTQLVWEEGDFPEAGRIRVLSLGQ